MSSSLFRKEAVEHQKERLLGEVLLFQPLSLKLLTGIAVAIAVIILGLLFLGTYSKKETVQGFLVPDKGIAKIYAPQMGTVSQVYVKEGQSVVAGQKLLSLVTERSLEGGEDLDSLVLKELDQSDRDLQNRVVGQKEVNNSDFVRLQNQITSLESELKQALEGLSLQKERVQITQGQVERLKKVFKLGYLSTAEYQKVIDNHLVQQQKQQELIRVESNTKTELMKLKSELSQFPTRANTRVLELEKIISENKQRHLEVRARKGAELRAPIAGVVDALMAKPGQFQGQAQLAQPLLAVIPQNSVLQAHMLVPTRAMGFIKAGQHVRIRYSAFPYQRYGVHEGVISSVSQHILNPNEIAAPIEIKEPVYQVVVNLNKQRIKAYGKQLPLQAGMIIEGDIIIETQSLFRWILDPIYTLKGKV